MPYLIWVFMVQDTNAKEATSDLSSELRDPSNSFDKLVGAYAAIAKMGLLMRSPKDIEIREAIVFCSGSTSRLSHKDVEEHINVRPYGLLETEKIAFYGSIRHKREKPTVEKLFTLHSLGFNNLPTDLDDHKTEITYAAGQKHEPHQLAASVSQGFFDLRIQTPGGSFKTLALVAYFDKSFHVIVDKGYPAASEMAEKVHRTIEREVTSNCLVAFRDLSNPSLVKSLENELFGQRKTHVRMPA
jgi:hypothetical protein